MPLSVTESVCVCRMKERAKRAGAQRKEEESERKSLQVIKTCCISSSNQCLLCSFRPHLCLSSHMCHLQYFCLLDQA